jgi:hypothetical protein
VNDAWTLKVFVVNQGQKAIRVQARPWRRGRQAAPPGRVERARSRLSSARRSPRRAAPGRTAPPWVAQATLTAPKNETLTNTLTWK